MQKIVNEKKDSFDEVFFNLMKKLQQQNTNTVIVPVESEADFDLLVPKHRTEQYLLKNIDGYCVLYTISLNERAIIYLFSKEIEYLVRENVKSWFCYREILGTDKQRC